MPDSPALRSPPASSSEGSVSWRLITVDGTECPGGSSGAPDPTPAVRPTGSDPAPDPAPTIRPANGATNMAVDAALLESVRAGGPPTLRFYRWSPATLSFGRNQPARGLYDADRARDRGIAFVRRPTGGQAVLHDDELTYAVAVPVDVLGRPREAYRAINEALVAGLRRLGLPATLARAAVPAGPEGDGGAAPLRPEPPDWAAACFRSPAEGEVTVRGAKLVGSAQRYERGAILQHGSILVGGSQAGAESLLVPAATAASPAVGSGVETRSEGEPGDPGWTTIEAELGRRLSWGEMVEAFVAGWTAVIGTALAPGPLSDQELARVRRLREHFASPGWTWRR